MNKKLIAAATVGYLGVANLATTGLFWYDKQQAKNQQWRVPENTLHATALLGGWPAGKNQP
jgi:uncharacterized membrane protein YsdA (DUF1294 family)